MSGKIVYLEQYSVAPSPSRDYYGVKVLRDEVILYLWRVSHGPHKTPIVRTARFTDFERNKALQDEICRAFGERLLKHVQSIAYRETSTLLTLPKCLIKRLTKYLSLQDIVKLSSLSYVANKIFNDNGLWKSLYKRYRGEKEYKYFSYKGMACDWKKLFKEEHMQEYTSEKKKSRGRPASMVGKVKTSKNESDRPINSKAKTATRRGMVDTTPQRSLEHVSQKSELKHHQQTMNKPQKVDTPEKIAISGREVSEIKSLQRISQTNIKNLRKLSTTAVNIPKTAVEIKNVPSEQPKEAKPTKEQSKVQKTTTITKTSHSVARGSDSKLSRSKSKSSLNPKVTKSEKTSIPGEQNGASKPQVKSKTSKVTQSKSTILTTDKVFRRNTTHVKNDSLDLSDLIEASLKNICSPRTIFDSEFSFIDKSAGCSGDSKLQSKAQEKRYKRLDSSKVTRTSRMGTVLESVSEKSEPVTTRIMDLDKKIGRLADIISSTSKDLNSPNKKTDKLQTKKDEPSTTGAVSDDYYERYGIHYKSTTLSESNNTQIQNSNTTNKALDKVDILKWLGTSNISTRSPFGTTKEQCEMEKALEDLYKQKFRRKK